MYLYNKTKNKAYECNHIEIHLSMLKHSRHENASLQRDYTSDPAAFVVAERLPSGAATYNRVLLGEAVYAEINAADFHRYAIVEGDHLIYTKPFFYFYAAALRRSFSLSPKRVAYYLACGSVPRFIYVTCGTPHCINSDHLRARHE